MFIHRVARRTIVAFLLLVFVVPTVSHGAGTSFEVSGWIPYWRDTQGMKSAKKHLDVLDVVYPFAFTVTTKGELRDQAGLHQKDWKSFIKAAQKKKVKIIPTVMWSDGASIHAVLSNDSLRSTHVAAIVKMVKEGKYDGVNIDYEAKKSETKDYFSVFLKELRGALDDSVLLTCAIEPRTPPDSLYTVVPETIAYANDYTEIAKYCDQIEIMGYDQQRADIKLNRSKNGMPYIPVADADWVEKVVQRTLEDFPEEKVVLGAPTYGHHYQVTVAPDWFKDYLKLGALNVPTILDIAKEHRVTPSRNKAGEMSFTYVPNTSKVKIPKVKVPAGTSKGNTVAAQALAYANSTGRETVFNVIWYSDAEAIKEKIDLAKEYNLRGVALFKIDGDEDQKVWKYLR